MLMVVTDRLLSQHERMMCCERGNEMNVPIIQTMSTQDHRHQHSSDPYTGRLARLVALCPGLVEACSALQAKNPAERKIFGLAIVPATNAVRLRYSYLPV